MMHLFLQIVDVICNVETIYRMATHLKSYNWAYFKVTHKPRPFLAQFQEQMSGSHCISFLLVVAVTQKNHNIFE